MSTIVRKGGTVADVRAIEPGLIHCVQLCDGVASPEAMRYEASYESSIPVMACFRWLNC
jgi:hypothetical protein